MPRKDEARGIFVTGTDTAVGKTVITGLLARYLSARGYNVITQKWVQTGCRKFMSADVGLHLKIMGRNIDEIKDYFNFVLPYMFKTPVSPHLASSIEHKIITAAQIIKSYKILSRAFDLVIVEGTGGVLVPFNKRNLLIDIAQKLRLCALVVVQNKLGAINHALLTIEALRKRKIDILGVVFNNEAQKSNIIPKDNPRIVRALSKENILGILAHRNQLDKLYKEFIPIGERVCIAAAKINGLARI